MSKLIAFGWYGGKYSHLDWLLPLLPKTTHYCEPFGGSAAVLINREPSPVETYNDIDGELVNFFRVLREQKNELIRAIAFTPFSRGEFELALSKPTPDLSDLELARRFFIRARQVRTGLAQTASSGRWAHCLLTSRAGMAGAVSRWLGSIDDLSKIVQRLLRVQIENCSAIEVIQRYDSEETLFYCDPPYPHDSRGDKNAYGYEMANEEHQKLAHILHNIKGKVAISGYDCELMEELYGDWRRIPAPSKSCHSVKQLRTEILWVNYHPDEQPIQINYRKSKKVKKTVMPTPEEILTSAFDRASESIKTGDLMMISPDITDKIELICRHPQNKSGIRFLLACSLAKVHQPHLDIRKPFTEIGGEDSYGGRYYDENYIATFINEYDLQSVCNKTTAFLTPAYRTKGTALTLDITIIGRPKALYRVILELLDDVYTGRILAEDLLTEVIKWLLIIRQERSQRLESLLANLRTLDDNAIPLSAEAIVKLIRQHLDCPRSSRLPVLIVAAAYQAASEYLGERCLPLESHNAADKQTGALGDLEITLINDNQVITCYEMKMKRVTINDINIVVQKLSEKRKNTDLKIDNYIFITTETIDKDIEDYAASLYERMGGIEIVILDCLGFLRHFLHLFHRLRMQFLEDYQNLVLAEPESAVNQALKEAFLALRQAAESLEIETD
ncbi:D12 class N6 adenine-specific DNA methyltransferase [Gloeothece citriformis PCC 7424]|uniref:D12 class N6 adenine-specific DNA methyltransferase n=1 Tax=Gloeothece citriformis (strain PCC 7424) TaxID=65393 RepID=B7KJW0_GLOC7|nr:DNA adenine methylase [Gloeothece citriformis]ACK69559.1 D12 class N6 adenine-specific DNA methyltransferase [Gloeothece citriformis PCC 7424]